MSACAQVKSPDDPVDQMEQPSQTDPDGATPPGDGDGDGDGCPASCDDGNECTDDSCENGSCAHTTNTGACSDDGNACSDDVCNSGTCTHPSNNSCACKEAGDCDDQNPCTDDACSAQKTCVYTQNTAPCSDDSSSCTDDVCYMGSCAHPDNGTCMCKSPADCNDSNACTDDDCVSGQCENEPNTAACADDGNVCTNDMCMGGNCLHPANTMPCADDGSSCTADVCSGGECTHADNKTCECTTNAGCDDGKPCTDDTCNAQNKCVYTNNTAACSTDNDRCTCDVCSAGICTHPAATAACTMSAPAVINNFDSAADWDAGFSTPAHLAITGKTNFDNTNLEGNSNLYLAESNTGALEIASPDLTGLTSLTVELQSDQTGTATMVEIGVFDSVKSAWVDKALSLYGTVSQGSYGTLTIPLADFAVSPCTITKVRLDFNVTGGQKVFRVQSIAAK